MFLNRWTMSVGLLAFASLMFGAALAQASLQTGDNVSIANGPGSPGGIFFLLDADGNKVTDTFCVQLEEYIRFGRDYQVSGISKATAGAGSRSLTRPGESASFAAWLFDRYLNGISGVGPALRNFDFTDPYGSLDAVAAAVQANQLQLAIWSAMGYTAAEIGGAGSGWYDTYDDKLAGWRADFDADVADGLWTGTGDVYVVSLLGKNSAGEYSVHAQDQLIRIPSDVVPEPMSLAVWSVLGLAGLCLARRRGM